MNSYWVAGIDVANKPIKRKEEVHQFCTCTVSACDKGAAYTASAVDAAGFAPWESA